MPQGLKKVPDEMPPQNCPTQRSQNSTQESRKMRLFLGKSALFALPLSRQQGVLS